MRKRFSAIVLNSIATLALQLAIISDASMSNLRIFMNEMEFMALSVAREVENIYADRCSRLSSLDFNISPKRNSLLHTAILLSQQSPQPPWPLVTSVTSGKIRNFVEKNAIENVYFSLLTSVAEQKSSQEAEDFGRVLGVKNWQLNLPAGTFQTGLTKTQVKNEKDVFEECTCEERR